MWCAVIRIRLRGDKMEKYPDKVGCGQLNKCCKRFNKFSGYDNIEGNHVFRYILIKDPFYFQFFLNLVYKKRMAKSDFMKMCNPAKLYLVVSVLGLVYGLFQRLSVITLGTNFIFVILWTMVLNYICSVGMKTVSWFLVLLPYLMLFLSGKLVIDMMRGGGGKQGFQSQIHMTTQAEKNSYARTSCGLNPTNNGCPEIIQQCNQNSLAYPECDRILNFFKFYCTGEGSGTTICKSQSHMPLYNSSQVVKTTQAEKKAYDITSCGLNPNDDGCPEIIKQCKENSGAYPECSVILDNYNFVCTHGDRGTPICKL